MHLQPDDVLSSLDLDRTHHNPFPDGHIGNTHRDERPNPGSRRQPPQARPLRIPGHSPVGRYYDPETGQFLTVDPLVDQTGQPYAYIKGNPVNLMDPSGLWCWNPGSVHCWTSDVSTVAGGASAVVALVPGLQPEAEALAVIAFASDVVGCVTSECDYPSLTLDAIALVPGAAAIYWSNRAEGYLLVEKVLEGVLDYDPWLGRVTYFRAFLSYVEETYDAEAAARAEASGLIGAGISGGSAGRSLAGKGSGLVPQNSTLGMDNGNLFGSLCWP